VAWVVLRPHKPKESKGPRAVPVATATVASQAVPISVDALGAAQAWQGVVIRPQVSGKLLRVPVREGSDVKAGDLLAEIDPAPFKAALLQAQGALARDQALLANAKLDLMHDQQLLAQDSIARQVADTQAALVKQYEGTVDIDKGAVANAQINVGYTRITAPIAGRVGVRLVDPGNLVSSTDTTGLLTLNQISPMAVTFTVPQGDFQKLSDVSQGFRRALVVHALSQETGDVLGSGELSIADNHVDPATGTVQLKARFPNTNQLLWPGQFLNVRLVLQTLPNAIVVPVTAVNQGPKGAFAYVVDAKNKVSAQPIVVETTQDELAVIKSGLKVGQVVVIDGQMVLKPGMTIRVRPPGPHHGGGGVGHPGGAPAAGTTGR
jgi:multidrug efflux system membrane fusion protein